MATPIRVYFSSRCSQLVDSFMKYRQPYSLYPRKMKNGKSVYYYRTYDPETGERTTGRSTGQTTKTAAHAYVLKLIEKGELLPKPELTFGQYARTWWTEDCQYLKMQRARGKSLTPGYIDLQRLNLKKHVLPFFENKALSRITAADVEKWIVHLKSEVGLSDASVRNCFAILRIMLNEAERLDMIYKNPLKRVRKISTKKSEKGILSIEEYRQLFDEVNIETIWNGNLLHFTANLLSASGGLRLGEVQALRNQDIFKNYVYVGHSYDRKYGLKSTKNKEERYVPIPEKTSSYLQRIKGANPEGFIFSIDGGKKPIRYRAITDFFYRVLEKIGIGEGERKARDISFHSHRHFFTTVLRKRIDDTKLGKITGHKSIVMLERYDHPKFDIDEYQDVLKIQSELWE